MKNDFEFVIITLFAEKKLVKEAEKLLEVL